MTDIVSALMLLLPLRQHCAFAKKTSAAAASLSRKKHLLLPLRFRAKNICCCRFAFAQKTSAGQSTKPIPDAIMPMRN
ncbi:hypothetical protein [Lysinibacillus sp. NPDC092081]|uniref:hypothetical protein n=1 Tax=Lysinibacillus sp. NPDC092081 TaxID=3364131 RepID=UPI00381D1745